MKGDSFMRWLCKKSVSTVVTLNVEVGKQCCSQDQDEVRDEMPALSISWFNKTR